MLKTNMVWIFANNKDKTTTLRKIIGQCYPSILRHIDKWAGVFLSQELDGYGKIPRFHMDKSSM